MLLLRILITLCIDKPAEALISFFLIIRIFLQNFRTWQLNQLKKLGMFTCRELLIWLGDIKLFPYFLWYTISRSLTAFEDNAKSYGIALCFLGKVVFAFTTPSFFHWLTITSNDKFKSGPPLLASDPNENKLVANIFAVSTETPASCRLNQFSDLRPSG